MVKDIESLFEKLKRTNPVIHTAAKIPKNLKFRLTPSNQGVSLDIIDASGKEVDPGYEFYSGIDRNILKEISRVKETQAFSIDWDTEPSDNRFYIDGNDYLMSLLIESDRLINAEGKQIKAAKGDARIKLSIKEDKDKNLLLASIGLWYGQKKIKKIFPVTETHILSNSTVYRVAPLGKAFNALPMFETKVNRDLLEQYLTLFFSNLSNIDISYSGYTLKNGTAKTTKPVLIFESVSQDLSLHMRVSATYPGFSPKFFDNFDLNRLILINDLEKTITSSPLVQGDIASCFKEIHSLLKKHAKSLKQNKDIYVHDNFIIIESELAMRFITRELTGLISKYTILGAEKLKDYKIKYIQPNLNLQLSHGIDFLEGEATIELEGETFSINDVLKQYRQNSYINLGDGSSAIINPDYMDKLNRIFKKQKSGVKISFFDLPIVEELIGEKTAKKAFNKSREIFLGFNKLKNSKKRIPSSINATLREYQKQGFRWASYLYKHKLGGCFADDMGLGKTIQTIALLLSIYPAEKSSTLIIMPKTLLFNWENELKLFAPTLSYNIYYGSSRDIKEALKKNVILTTYALVRNDIEKLKEEKFHMVVLDESQNIKNVKSKTSKAIMLLQTEHRLALSGTPIENNLGELYSLFRFLNPSMFGTISDFTKNYLNPIQKDDNKTVVKELRKKIYPFILRRLKTQVLKDLPDKMEQTLFVDMTKQQAKLYHQRRQMYRDAIKKQIKTKGIGKSQFFILQALGELRQIASIPELKSDNRIISPKREILIDHVLDAVAGKHKVLVFANYLLSLDCISQDMDKQGIGHLIMTGATRDRSSIVDRFQTDDNCMALLMTLKTGGLGLNLTEAEYVFLFDPWWNIAAENQAIDRAHRIGQKNTVFSYRLIARDSIEEKILQLQAKKKELFDSLIASDSASIKQMDEEDIDYVLGD